MDQCDQKDRVYRHPPKPKLSVDWKQSTYSYKLKLYHSDILNRLAKRQSLASIAKLYGCSYQAIQRIRDTYGNRRPCNV